MPASHGFRKPRDLNTSIFAPHELASMQSVIEAVCSELGVEPGEYARRLEIAARVMAAYSRGGRQPLNLVHAALGGTRGHEPHIAA